MFSLSDNGNAAFSAYCSVLVIPFREIHPIITSQVHFNFDTRYQPKVQSAENQVRGRLILHIALYRISVPAYAASFSSRIHSTLKSLPYEN